MADVKDNSYIVITRRIGARTENLANQLFNGYVYNMSLQVGYNGAATALTLNLALNKTLNQVQKSSDVITDRKKDINRVNSLIESQKSGKIGSVGNLGNAGTGSSLGAQHNIAKLADSDFDINPNFIGINCSYDISIRNSREEDSYTFNNFKITSFAVNKTNDRKILTLTLQDNSFVLDKIFIGLLGQHVALDQRSESEALVSNIQMSCPPVGTSSRGGTLTLNNLAQTLHFSSSTFKTNFFNQLGISNDKDYADLDFVTGDLNSEKENYVIIKSKNKNKSIFRGYGAVIILGEEDFKDAPCDAAEISYTFDTLLKAIQALGIELGSVKDAESVLKDKSGGRLRKSYSGTLRQVLNQWCEDYAYSYSIDFNLSTRDRMVLKAVDLASSMSKESLLKAKLDLENAEASQNDQDKSFVIKNQNLSYDLSQQQLRLYSSYYYKNAKEREINYQQDLGAVNLNAIDIRNEFSFLFYRGGNTRDFSGSKRNYFQVLYSAMLGKFSPALRAIYNYRIGAVQALGFLPYYTGANNAELPIPRDRDGLHTKEIAQVFGLSPDGLFSDEGMPIYAAHAGFYNQELAESVFDLELLIADSIGKYYWSDEKTLADGEAGNTEFYINHEVDTTAASVQKVLVGELYQLDIFKRFRYLIGQISSVFSSGTSDYYRAYRVFQESFISISNACAQAEVAFNQLQGNSLSFKKYRFFYERSNATYGVYQDFINDLQKLKLSIAAGTTVQPVELDLASLYKPFFKELTPVSLGALQAVIPINFNNVSFGSFKFGVLMGVQNAFQPYEFYRNVGVNTIEFQNSIYERCKQIVRLADSGRQSVVLKNLKTCNKTLLYQTCIQPFEQAEENKGIDEQLSFAAGPNPNRCIRLKIVRRNGVISPNFVLNSLYSTLQTDWDLSALATSATNVSVQTLRNLNPISFGAFRSTTTFETIAAPSQASFPVTLVSRTNYKYFKPFINFVDGGLENPQDLLGIINNQNFSLQIDLNNITPNLRELFADDTVAQYINNDGVSVGVPSNSPMYIQYQGYNQDNPAYEFTTFNQYHAALRNVFDLRNKSLSEPNLLYSIDLFCSEINSTLKNALSIDNGLSSLNINLNQQGLNLSCSFESSPASVQSLETLILRNRPNIKLVNTNVFQ